MDTEHLKQYGSELERLAKRSGLDYFPVEFEVVPPHFMMEVAVYGLPIRMPHWSFGVRYIHQLVQHKMGHSHIFEVVFPGNPGHAYLAGTNALHENTLVTAHVLGHADFSHNNLLFQRSQEQVGYKVVEQAAAHARRIADAIEEYGQQRVEQVLDAALALEQHIDFHLPLARPRYPTHAEAIKSDVEDAFRQRFDDLTATPDRTGPARARPQRLPTPPHPEFDLLWFIAQYGPELEDWERDVFLSVRRESYYFYPVFACQIMNEGWASYWHARLLREADFLPEELYVDAMKTHSDVVRPHAGEQQVALAVNPYHLGFQMWERIVDQSGMDAARRIMRENDDFGFIRNHLDESLADDLKLFEYTQSRNGEGEVKSPDLASLRETLLAPRFNFGAPRVYVSELRNDGTLVLGHDHAADQRGLDLERARHVLHYIHRVWRRPVELNTVDGDGANIVLVPGTGRATTH